MSFESANGQSGGGAQVRGSNRACDSRCVCAVPVQRRFDTPLCLRVCSGEQAQNTSHANDASMDDADSSVDLDVSM